MPPRELTVEELRILKGLSRADGTLSWRDSCDCSGVGEREFKRAVGALMRSGLVRARDVAAIRPRLALSDAGAIAVARQASITPARRLFVSLTSVAANGEALQVDLSDEADGKLARMSVAVDSHRLSAIRYFLLWNPGAVTQDLGDRAAGEIGFGLLPSGPSCRTRADLSQPCCNNCVRGHVASAVSSLSGGEYLRLELSVTPPWTFVPWELAAISVNSHPVLDPRLSIVRRVAGRDGTNGVFTELRLLIASAAMADSVERANLSIEARALEDAVRAAQTDFRIDVKVLEQYTSADELADAIRTVKPNVVQLLGHGSSAGLVVDAAVIDSEVIAEVIAQAPVELVLLASCYGSTAFGVGGGGESLATKIVRRGTPAVVAFEGQAEASHTQAFALRFYDRLLQGVSVEQAVMSGRQALRGPSYQWGQLVLSMP